MRKKGNSETTNYRTTKLNLSIDNIFGEVFQRFAFGTGFHRVESAEGAVYILFGFEHGLLGGIARADIIHQAGHVVVIGPAAVG